VVVTRQETDYVFREDSDDIEASLARALADYRARHPAHVLKRISGHRVQVGGTQATGWSPAVAGAPLSAPVRDVVFDLEIQFDGCGYLVCCVSQAGDLYCDTWHETVEDAETLAREHFGVRDDQWEPVAQERNT
jgi:hypothetical protein